ncbi:MAG: flagellar hook-associated protein FlgL [Actinobacteria bacterium]|nr:flagellar hook-associated protein FlgL [Actinomycetota bacterium]
MQAAMRVTSLMMSCQSMAGLEANQQRLAEIQRRMTTGKTIGRPSDDPAGTASALRIRSELAQNKQYSRAIEDGKAWIDASDSTLSSMAVQVRRARELVQQGINGTSSQQSRDAMATELEGIRDSLIGLANTTYLGRPIFGGTTSGQQAYDPATGAYLGDGGTVARQIGTTASSRIDVTGPEAFGPAGADLFTALSTAITDLRTAPANLANDLDALAAAGTRLTTAQTDLGARFNRLDAAATRIEATTGDLTASLSGIEDIDLARTIYDLNVAQLSYQSALQATAKVIQPSLLDFLR